MISEKVKALLSLKGKKISDLARYMEISPQNMRNKFYRNTISAEDLIKVSEFTGCPLVFEVSENQRIVFDKDDLKKVDPSTESEEKKWE